MARVPESVIAEIRDRTDLVELIGGYVQLRRSGRNWQGLCPFHSEKTPSFNVSPERNIYHCFGCGVTGDAIRFLMEYDHLSFPEALRELAGRVGVDLSPWEGRGGGDGEEFDLMYRAHAVAERLYRATLAGAGGEAARAEIARRGLSEATVEEYRLGAAPDAWDRLLQACAADGVRPEILEKAGLAIPRRTDGGAAPGWYDRFRGRLMFPIPAPGGKVIGFGGRVLDDGEPKYLNSPETPLFRKRKTLYGIPQAQAAMRETRAALLVEGYTDVLALANAGIRGALAALGTAFTADHAGWLARSCDRVTVLFDGDEAGRKAAMASCGPLLGAGLDVRVVLLPAGEDPDSFLRAQGPEALVRKLDEGEGVLDVLLGDEAWEGGAERERAVRRALETFVPIDDDLRRRVWIEELANRVGLPAGLLEEQVAGLRSRAAGMRRRMAAREESRRSPGADDRPPPPDEAPPVDGDEAAADGAAGDGVPPPRLDEPAGPLSALERTFLGVLVHDESLGEALLERFGPDDFEHPVARRIVATATGLLARGQPPETGALLDAHADDPAAIELLGQLGVSGSYAVGLDRQAEDCRLRMERRTLEHENERILAEMRRAKARGDDPAVLDCARRRGEIARQIAALNAPRTKTT